MGQETSEEIIRALHSIPPQQQSWRARGGGGYQRAVDRFQCANCHNRNIQAFADVYGHGTSKSSYTRGLFIQTGWSRTTRQSELAQKCAPPKKKKYVWAILFLLVMAAGMTYAVKFTDASPTDPSMVILGLFGWAGLYLGARSVWFNVKTWPELMRTYSELFWCRRCGTVTRIAQ